MKRLGYILTAIILSSAITSCTKVIDVNISNAPTKVVIEGKVNNGQPATIRVSKTVEVDMDNTFPQISGATVVLADGDGNVETLLETSNGIYTSQNIIGIPGKTYTLEVIVDGVTYTAVSTMPPTVPVDSLGTRTFSGFGDESVFAVVHYTDPATLGNNYRAVLYVNDELIPDIFIEDDIYINGNTREAVLFSGEYSLVKGDKIRAEINCLDKPVYDYLLELIQVNGSSEVASPSNPVSNIQGGALGFFTAQTSSTMEMTID